MKLFVFLLLIAAVVVLAGCSPEKPAAGSNDSSNVASEAGLNKAVIFKSLSCGCCSNYVNYMKKQKGFEVATVDVGESTSVKDKYGIPPNLQTCHTMIIGDYFIEGHVPIEAVKKLLEEKPQIKGIAIPGMPEASPGMPGVKRTAFEIYAVSFDGETSHFMTI